jgi:pimeloyl-ACP methyl ester carboxylesterase
VPDAGHAVHLEQPAEFGRIVADFLCKSMGAEV